LWHRSFSLEEGSLILRYRNVEIFDFKWFFFQ